MGRREQRTDAVEPSREPANRAGQAVRRALGRLAAHVSVRELPEPDMTPAADVRTSVLAPPLPLGPGKRERDWKPTSEMRQAIVPQAEVGARDGNLLPVVRLAADNAALAPPLCCTMPIVQKSETRTESADLLLPAFVIRLPDAFLALPADPVHVRSADLSVSRVTAQSSPKMKGWGIKPPKCGVVRLPRIADPRVRLGGDAILSRIALTRRGLEPPPAVPLGQAFALEERRLAEAAQLPPNDVMLLGIYPGVPILAVSRLVVAEEAGRCDCGLSQRFCAGETEHG